MNKKIKTNQHIFYSRGNKKYPRVLICFQKSITTTEKLLFIKQKNILQIYVLPYMFVHIQYSRRCNFSCK